MTTDLKTKITSMFSNHEVGTLATIRENRPYSRFMLFFNQGLVLYCATNEHTHKIEDIKSNPHVHILLGMQGSGWNDPYAEIEAEASFEESADLKQKFWDEKLSEWINSPEDPEYLLLKLTPSVIRYYEKAGSEAEVLEG